MRKSAWGVRASAQLGRVLGGAFLGAGLMYLFDPDSGRKRRGVLRGKATHARVEAQQAVRKTARDSYHRGQGLLARARTRWVHEEVGDDLVAERVRAKLGRLVSHPSALHVACRDGVVTVAGPILADEASRLVRDLASVRGVRAVDDRLDRHRRPGDHPALQGGAHREHRAELLQENWAPAIRLLAGSAGGALVGLGARRGGFLGAAMSSAGAGVLLRAATNLPARRLFGIGGGRRGIDVQKDIHIEAPVQEVFGFFQNFENFPKFMSHLRSIRVSGEVAHWEAMGPAHLPVRWDAQLTRFVPYQLIAWKSVPGSMLRSAGIVRFQPDRGGTRVEIRMSYNPPGGAIAHALASLFGADPKKVMDDDLLRLKSLLEHGKATAHGHTVLRDELETSVPYYPPPAAPSEPGTPERS